MKPEGMTDEFKSNFTDITLAMDLSLSSPGFAVLAVFEGSPIALEVTSIKTNAKTTHGARLTQIAEEIAFLIRKYQPEHIVREKGFSRFAATTQALFKVVGVSDYISHRDVGKAVDEIAVTTVKKAVTGDGRADKQAVQDAVLRILQIDTTDYFTNDDESDACAVGIAYLLGKKLIDKGAVK